MQNKWYDSYFKKVKKLPILNQKQIEELFVEIKNWSKKARNKLAESHLRYVVDFIEKLDRKDYEMLDLIQKWNVYLFDIIDSYVDFKIPFSIALEEGLIKYFNNLS